VTTIRVMAGGLASDAVESRVAEASPGWRVETECEIYYPYHWVLLRYVASTLFGRSASPVWCVVDARTGLAATTDPFELAFMERNDLGAAKIADPRVDAADAIAIARRYAAYVMRQRRKALVVPRVDVVERAVVYKPMSTVRLSRAGEPSFRVLVDRMSGGFHVLSSSAGERGAPRAQWLM
jgi:hypothetical protein